MMGVELRFPQRPDWDWLRLRYDGTNLLHLNADLLDVARVSRGRYGYLATPFSGAVVGATGRYRRAMAEVVAAEAANWCLWGALNKLTLLSPVVQSMAMVEADLGRELDPLDRDFWQRWCLPLLQGAGAVVVPPMPGWELSHGVWNECCWALRHNVRVFVIGSGISAALATPQVVA